MIQALLYRNGVAPWADYTPPRLPELSYFTIGILTFDLGIKKKLKDNKSSLQFAVSNVLNTLAFELKADVPDHNIYTDVRLHTFYRGFRLTYTRSFGKEKLKDKRERNTGSEEERGRVRQQ